MTDLAAWLLNQIAEDEEAANAARPHEYLPTRNRTSLDVGWNAARYASVSTTSTRVLAECAAKRRIVEGITDWSIGDSVELERVLPYLALPYADRPGYDEGWRP